MSKIAAFFLPLVICVAGILMLLPKKNYFDAFLTGAREGLRGAVGLLPTLCALLVAVRMLTASGLTEWLSDLLAGPAERIGLPPELIPLILTRPFSGSASLAAFSELLEQVGADSFLGFCSSVIMGSSDTFVYILMVYFSAAGVRKTRYAFPVAFAVMVFSLFFCCFLARIWYK